MAKAKTHQLIRNIGVIEEALELGSLLETLTTRAWYERTPRTPMFSRVGYLRLKRGMDIVLSALLLIPVLVAILLCAIAIKLDSFGPIFFLQERTGRGGQRFKMFKLRTMIYGADSFKKKYAHLNKLSYPDFKIPHDPRITKLGRFLRKTSLDELPQILNVLRGDMSLVGPRPTSFPSSTYDLWHTVRLEVTPGITGLWQISGSSDIDFDERIRLDVAYIRNLSLWLDIEIMLRTLGSVLKRKGAE